MLYGTLCIWVGWSHLQKPCSFLALLQLCHSQLLCHNYKPVNQQRFSYLDISPGSFNSITHLGQSHSPVSHSSAMNPSQGAKIESKARKTVSYQTHKTDCLQNRQRNPGIFAGTETWLNAETPSSEFFLANQKILRQDRETDLTVVGIDPWAIFGPNVFYANRIQSLFEGYKYLLMWKRSTEA